MLAFSCCWGGWGWAWPCVKWPSSLSFSSVHCCVLGGWGMLLGWVLGCSVLAWVCIGLMLGGCPADQ